MRLRKQNYHQEEAQHEWGRAKAIRESHGLTAPQLRRYADHGLIRTSHIRLPGQIRGVRLFHIGDIDALIAASIENRDKHQPYTTDTNHHQLS
jgi:hypothetical protein